MYTIEAKVTKCWHLQKNVFKTFITFRSLISNNLNGTFPHFILFMAAGAIENMSGALQRHLVWTWQVLKRFLDDAPAAAPFQFSSNNGVSSHPDSLETTYISFWQQHKSFIFSGRKLSWLKMENHFLLCIWHVQ